MQFITVGDLDSCAEDLLYAVGKRLSGIAAIGQNIRGIRKIVLVAVKSLQRALAIRDVGGGDVEGVGQAVGIDADMSLDAGDELAAIKAFILRRIRVLDALRVNDEKTGCRLPSEALSDLANHIFLTPLPKR